MAFETTENGFIDYRYVKSTYAFAKKVALKLNVNQDDGIITASYAICNERDNFCRKTARDITDKRMEEGIVITGKYDREMSLVDNVKMIVNNIVEGTDPDQKPTQLIKQLSEAFEEIFIFKQLDVNFPEFTQV